MSEYTKEQKLAMSLRDAQTLIDSLVGKIDWEPIPGTYARDVARLRTSIRKTLEETGEATPG